MKYSVYSVKREGFDVEARLLNERLQSEIKTYTGGEIKIVNHYLMQAEASLDIEELAKTVFSEPQADEYSIGNYDFSPFKKFIAIRQLPGQYDQRADSAAMCVSLISGVGGLKMRTAKIYCFSADVDAETLSKIKEDLINPVEAMEVDLAQLENFDDMKFVDEGLHPLEGFSKMDEAALQQFVKENGLAMSLADLVLIRDYFISEQREPNLLELKVLDTYWSDHCRHTTFNTELTNIKIEDTDFIKKAYELYLAEKKRLGREAKPVTLMDIATISQRVHKEDFKDHNIDVSDEINACSIKIDVRTEDGEKKPALLMFKNETHNHPTEIEPFGGAATCLGGAIRDPLSGRAYVYGAMRISGAEDPTKPREETLKGKLPQQKICRDAAHGYSSYGNQIGLSTGIVREFYHKGFEAKTLELGAVIASVPRENVVRLKPEEGDVVILIGGRTGRDGVGGATGSSKSHDTDSLALSGAEVQKGNAPTERKIQRLFMKPEFAKMIKKSNDFGAGGVSVAVGELADSIDIYLDAVTKKYEGLSPLETAISESQERMAIVVRAKDEAAVIAEAAKENLEATKIADITNTGRLRMFAGGKTVLDLSRSFLDENGAPRTQEIDVKGAAKPAVFFEKFDSRDFLHFDEEVAKLQNASQKGLIEMFDSTIGAASVFMPLGGRERLSPSDVMVHRIPYGEEISETFSAMTFGFDPELCELSPYHGAYYAVVMSLARLVAAGFSHREAKLSMQEYFPKLENSPAKWALPFQGLLGCMKAALAFEVPQIGGKDSMSGTFNDIHVPPSVVSFAVSYGDEEPLVNVMKNKASSLYILLPELREDGSVDEAALRKAYDGLLESRKDIISAKAVDHKGILVDLYEMACGNRVDVKLEEDVLKTLPKKPYGAILIQAAEGLEAKLGLMKLGSAGGELENTHFIIGRTQYCYNVLKKNYLSTLEKVYTLEKQVDLEVKNLNFEARTVFHAKEKFAAPRVFIPAFPGTNCELDTMRAFKKAGAHTQIGVFRNTKAGDIEASIEEFRNYIRESQIIALPGGFSAGDEPEGSAKFIASIFRNPILRDEVNTFLRDRDGLILGICNGFQALVKLGVFETGLISEVTEDSPTLTYNAIGRHQAFITKIRIASTNSPWLSVAKVGDIYDVAISHGEGRFVAKDEVLKKFIEQGQIATQYVDFSGKATMNPAFNPNASVMAIEGVMSPDGRILGKMGHTERVGRHLYLNLDATFDEKLFLSGVGYFK